MQDTRPRIEITPSTKDVGNRQCRTAAKQMFGKYLWVAGNLPGEKQTALNTILNHLVRASDYLDLESTDGLPLDVWCEFRDDLSDAFQDQYASPDLVSLVETIRKYNVPKQYMFDILEGVDWWIRNRSFETFDEVLVFAYRMGGTALTSAVPVCGFVKPGYEDAAVKAGQAVFLTQVLANIIQDIKLNKIFVAKQDIEETELSISRVKVRQASPGLQHLIRLYGARIEKLMYDGGKLADYLDFDARRTFTSLMAVHWAMLMKMRLNPESVLNPDGILTRREMFLLKTRHLMGLEGNLPFISSSAAHHH